MGCNPCSSDPPDTSGVNAAAISNADVSRDALTWFQNEYANTADERADATTRANAVSDAQLATMRQQNETAQDYNDYNRNTFRPLEQRIVADATNYDTPERRQAAADAASADVRIAQAGQQGALTRSLQRSGVNPGSGAALATMGDMAFQGTKAEAGAATMARRNVESIGAARMADAANLGRNLPSAQAAAVSTGIQAGNSSAANSGQALNAANSGSSLMQTGYNTAIQGTQSAGNLYGQQAQLQSGGGNSTAALMQGVGGIMQGYGAIFGSSKKLKTRTGNVSMSEALRQVNELDVDGWKYKPGVEDEDTHVGPYAEDVQRVMGDRTAPGGRMIDVARMGKKNTKSIQALTSQLEQLESELAELEH